MCIRDSRNTASLPTRFLGSYGQSPPSAPRDQSSVPRNRGPRDAAERGALALHRPFGGATVWRSTVELGGSATLSLLGSWRRPPVVGPDRGPRQGRSRQALSG